MQVAHAAEITRAATNQTKVVVYRDPSDFFAPSMNSYLSINDKSLGIVDKKTAAVFCVNPGQYKLSNKLEDSLIYSEKNTKNLWLLPSPAQIRYVKINTIENGGGELLEVSEIRAMNEIQNFATKQLANEHSVDCQEYVAPPPPPPPPMPVVVPIEQKVILGADGTFAINRYNLGDLRPGGKTKIDNMLDSLVQNKVNVSNIEITGHADYLGSEKRRQFLSEQRAATIKQYILSTGKLSIQPSQIMTSGRSSNEPVVTNCSAKSKRQVLINCLEPNRRIEINLRGTVVR